MHYDRNDFISVLVMIHLDDDQRGGLEIGGIDLAFNLKIGDVLILDTDQLCHGTEEGYDDSLEDVLSVSATDRLVGLFIIHRSYLRLFGVDPNTLCREKIEALTIPVPPPLKKREKVGEQTPSCPSYCNKLSSSSTTSPFSKK